MQVSSNMKLSEVAYREIKEMIKDNQFRPGDPLPEAQLCAILKMSRTPVREALRRLQNEQIVKIKPHNGAFVSTLDFTQLYNIYKAREAIEGMIASLNCREPVSVKDYMPIKDELADLIAQPASKKNNERLHEISVELIRIMRRNCENPILEDLSIMITEQINTLAHITRTIPQFPKESAPEHLSILEAIIQKNGPLAEATTRTHVRNSFNRILMSIKN